MPRPRTGLRRRLFAYFHSKGYPKRYENFLNPLKRELISPLTGAILEIGPGTGANLRFYSPHVKWIGLEPNLHMHPYLHAEARALSMNIDLHATIAESIPLPNHSIDAVVSTLVLCSVTDPARVLREILRILRPAGRFIFLEHTAAPPRTPLCRLQHFLKPTWQFLGDGCHPDRPTDQTISQAPFAHLDLRHLTAPIPIASPHIAGVALT